MSRLIWHRRDLRLRDNELYHSGAHKIYSLFIFHPSDYSPRTTGISDEKFGHIYGVTHGPHYTRRLLDAVHALRHNLQSLGGNLIVRAGDPLEVIPNVANELRVEEVAWSEIPGHYEYVQSKRLKDIFLHDARYRRAVHTTCSLTLIHPDDLPTDRGTWERLARPKEKRKKRTTKRIPDASMQVETINASEVASNLVNISCERFEGMPSIMGDFRRAARTSASVRELLDEPNPQCIAKELIEIHIGDIPSLKKLSQPLIDSAVPILGCLPKEMIQKLVKSANEIPNNIGIDVEEQFTRHLRNFVRNHASSADRSLCDVSDNDSSTLSVPLALGVLSPRQVYNCVKHQQCKLENGPNAANPNDLNWLISHMEMRDFFLFDSFRTGLSAHRLLPTTPAHKPNVSREWLPLRDNQDAFVRWASGHTNLPLVDAGMEELVTTGYTSNRVRQNLASVLTKDLQLDWRLGAEFFQLTLEDHCVAANTGNWRYFAGVGGDPKNRHFRTVSQAWRYDPDGRYVQKWIERLRDSDEYGIEGVLRPWGFCKDWGAPIVPPETQLTWKDRERLENEGRITAGD